MSFFYLLFYNLKILPIFFFPSKNLLNLFPSMNNKRKIYIFSAEIRLIEIALLESINIIWIVRHLRTILCPLEDRVCGAKNVWKLLRILSGIGLKGISWKIGLLISSGLQGFDFFHQDYIFYLF